MEKQWIVYNALNDEHEFADTWEEVRDRVSTYAGRGCPIGKINVYQKTKDAYVELLLGDLW